MNKESSKAIGICQQVGKPSPSHKKLLNRLFPSSSAKLPSKRKFDPAYSCVAEGSKAKKKIAIPKHTKSRKIKIVLLDESTTVVPKGNVRKHLLRTGRMKETKMRRDMSPACIRQLISDTFSNFPCARNAKVLSCGQDNSLSQMVKQDLNGDEIAEVVGCGSLYLCEVC